MKSRRFKRFLFLFIIFLLVFFVLLIWAGIRRGKFPAFSQNYAEKSGVETVEETVPDIAAFSGTGNGSEGEREKAETEEQEREPEDEAPPTEEMETPVTAQPIYPTDIYSESGITAEFQCYIPDADAYLWEYYDVPASEWIPAESTFVGRKKDELHRSISFYNMESVPENDGTMIRCTVTRSGQEDLVKTATLYVIKEITEILIDAAEYPEGYINTQDIPVTVIYGDGKKEVLQGLNGMFFVDKKESRESEDSVSGNRIETVTTVYTECKYIYLGLEEKKVLMRYRIKDSFMEEEILLCGKDTTPPDISDVQVCDHEISIVDKSVPVTVMITATDNDTPADKLSYAFLPEGQEAEEADWKQTASFEVDITQNGMWTAYCRDQSGNISAEEKKVIVVDQKPPVITKLYLSENVWCQKNKIIVEAEDELEIQYRYCCPDTGEDSGWIADNVYEIFQNGTWEIRVKDAVENISETRELTVSNIDTQAPVIISITEIEGE